MKDFMTVNEAATFLKKSTSMICKLCVRGKLTGAYKLGKKMWLIPEKSIMEYVPGPKGFAAVKARKQEELKELKEVINNGGGSYYE